MDKTNELLKKQLRFTRLLALLQALLLLAVAATCAVVVTSVFRIEATVTKIDEIVDDLAVVTGELAEVDWDEITLELEGVSRNLSCVDWYALSGDISDMALQAQESLRLAGDAVRALDIDALNEAIADLQAVIQPMAELAERFG